MTRVDPDHLLDLGTGSYVATDFRGVEKSFDEARGFVGCRSGKVAEKLRGLQCAT
jgi:hypothetical protein